mmetsp:Transcript_3157/g.7945  ORF Transcript_3157/g.7945 Transcript_3157/m.7945 type:complete len:241 (+) Transcript_3157:82-804(+)
MLIFSFSSCVCMCVYFYRGCIAKELQLLSSCLLIVQVGVTDVLQMVLEETHSPASLPGDCFDVVEPDGFPPAGKGHVLGPAREKTQKCLRCFVHEVQRRAGNALQVRVSQDQSFDHRHGESLLRRCFGVGLLALLRLPPVLQSRCRSLGDPLLIQLARQLLVPLLLLLGQLPPARAELLPELSDTDLPLAALRLQELFAHRRALVVGESQVRGHAGHGARVPLPFTPLPTLASRDRQTCH